ncbi:MAG: AAA family ATPase [Lentisphaeria bacterium]|nr:AAA family ATPase [Lentisphaeria bacterium]
MKLKKLHIDHFRHISDVDIDFTQCNNFAVLIGNNGSGKSSILELIAQLIVQATYKKSHNTSDFLEYEIDGKNYILDKNYKKANPKIKLPERMVAVYSGEDQKLWNLSFKIPYKTRYKNIRANGIKKPNIYYYDRNYWEVALLSLAISNLPGNQDFLQNVIGIYNIEKINFLCNKKLRAKWKKSNEILQFYDELNKNNDDEIVLTLKELKDIVVGYEIDFFDNLANCIEIDKENLIKEITITYKTKENDSILKASFLSEGEKKLLLLRAILEFATQEDTLILLDEPDAHIHESRKTDLINLLQEYTASGRAIVMTTHSAKIADQLSLNNIVMLDRDEQRNVKVEDKTKQELRNKLLSGSWDIMQQHFFSNSTRPLLLVEGLSDVKYIKKAMEILDHELYQKIDILPFNGTGNASDFINNLMLLINSSKPVIVLFDRDPAGAKGLAECIEKEPKTFSNNYRENVTTYKKNNIYFCMLPVPSSQNGKNGFLIEDYFHNSIKKSILKKQFKRYDGSLKTIPSSLENIVKSGIEQCFDKTPAKLNFDNFSVLIDKINRIINGQEYFQDV